MRQLGIGVGPGWSEENHRLTLICHGCTVLLCRCGVDRLAAYLPAFLVAFFAGLLPALPDFEDEIQQLVPLGDIYDSGGRALSG
ncbi:hypothetical protein SBA5_380004 [Candidatus Sulfotelmatomonas gaucii]|uniref:Uncharacterized protein n=1 Tax=Candidatus Sulfuritelmatomonas gaucii TaxID=2043161 RepID=A0A2N9LJC0_9BACT|nr:hypothetical protein SBA5_380004 [Candidatus Sulfotelmatomonas gaucii]